MIFKKYIVHMGLVFRTVALGVLCLTLNSCKSREYYVEQAVEEARKYALEKLPELSPLQRNFIRYNKPVLMIENYMGREFFAVTPIGGNDFAQMCVMWQVPGEDLPVIVCGLSDHGIRGWSPNRILRRKYDDGNVSRDNAARQAMLYVVNNMLYLSSDDMIRVRFAPPESFASDFPLDLNNRPENVQEASRNLKGQYSFAWPSTDKGKSIVVSGICGNNFSGWIPVTGLLRDDTELEQYRKTAPVGDKK